VVESRSSFESQGKPIVVECFAPDSPGRHPAVVVVHGSGGMLVGGRAFRDAARTFADKGYVAHVVHYFDLTGTLVADPKSMRENFAGWMRVVADGVSYAIRQPNVDPNRVGLVGFSLGSYLSLSLAAYDHRVSAVVDFFGGFPDVLARDLKTLPPVLILHGDADRIVPVSEARELVGLCKEKKVLHELVIYPGQGHGFTGDPARDALLRASDWLDRHVKSADPSAPRRETSSVPRPESVAEFMSAAAAGN
jgi:carboxymethylenebutenolidase